MRSSSKIIAILGTVIIHLTAGIIFMSFKLYSLKTKEKKAEKFEIEFSAIEEKKIIPKTVQLSPTSGENVLQQEAEMLNIARNLANKSDVKVNAKDYINQVKDELIKSGKLGKDNYIDNPRDNSQSAQDDQYLLEKSEKDKEKDKEMESQKMAANYHGPTRIYYDLAGRNHTYLPIPIYKCEGSGKIVLIIDVNQRGIVENASVLESESSTTDECLVQTAVGTALISRFEPNLNAPRIQKGTLTYLFVAQ
ncbi:MAG: hypothetical protein Q8868_13465 [Bacteroidota bacterium]|nr:hypothetical protein [Bacteroidota bacterium]